MAAAVLDNRPAAQPQLPSVFSGVARRGHEPGQRPPACLSWPPNYVRVVRLGNASLSSFSASPGSRLRSQPDVAPLLVHMTVPVTPPPALFFCTPGPLNTGINPELDSSRPAVLYLDLSVRGFRDHCNTRSNRLGWSLPQNRRIGSSWDAQLRLGILARFPNLQIDVDFAVRDKRFSPEHADHELSRKRWLQWKACHASAACRF